jgi:hypothetical protein
VTFSLGPTLILLYEPTFLSPTLLSWLLPVGIFMSSGRVRLTALADAGVAARSPRLNIPCFILFAVNILHVQALDGFSPQKSVS